MIELQISSLVNQIESNQNTDELCSSFVEGTKYTYRLVVPHLITYDSFSADLKNSKLSIIRLVESLECLLTSTDIILRRGGNEFLSSVLSELPSNYLNSQEIELLTNFFCDRMLDHHSITPAALKAYAALVNFHQKSSCTRFMHKIQVIIAHISA